MLAHDALVRIGIACVTLVRPNDPRQLCTALVRRASHQAGDRCREGTACVGVVREACCHEECTEVGVANTQLAIATRGLTDRHGREVGEADRDIHRGDDDLDGLGESIRIERVVVLEEGEQIQ